MRLRLVLLTAALVALSTGAAAQNPPRDRGHGGSPAGEAQPLRPGRPADDPVAMVPDSDREMQAAIAEARRTLPSFWSLYESDRQVRSSARLKVGFPTPGDGREHMWLHDIRRADGVITGVLENIPEAPMTVRKGDTVTIDAAEISDWGYERAGRLHGNFTTRALLKYLQPELADQLRALLSERPLEGTEI